jgi:spore germination protein YaaH
VLPHLSQLTEVNPFGYTVASDGTVYDTANLNDDPWKTFIQVARSQKVRVIPTVMWGSGDQIHKILSNYNTRLKLEDDIAALVKQNNWDGIDIDFEAKKAETKTYFSLFLKGLYQRLGPKWLYCSIESRTPLSSRYDTIPTNIQYANDLVQINKYCDRVQVMTYDQGTIDIRLNAAAAGVPYAPVSDPLWVKKVITYMAKTISKNKILIGIPTYGYEWQVTPLTQQGYRYDLLWSFNPRYATDIATKAGIAPTRNLAGELSFMYRLDGASVPTNIQKENPPQSADITPANDLSIPTTAFSDVATAPVVREPFNLMWWSDAISVAQKIAIAKELGVRGVSVFKFDGGEDQGIWDVLK